MVMLAVVAFPAAMLGQEASSAAASPFVFVSFVPGTGRSRVHSVSRRVRCGTRRTMADRTEVLRRTPASLPGKCLRGRCCILDGLFMERGRPGKGCHAVPQTPSRISPEPVSRRCGRRPEIPRGWRGALLVLRNSTAPRSRPTRSGSGSPEELGRLRENMLQLRARRGASEHPEADGVR